MTTWAHTNIGLVSTVSLNSGSVTTYAYDSAGQATGITHKKANATIIEQLAYTYDNAGNRKTVTENSGDVSTWTYDNANQLTVEQRSGGSAYTTTYTYDNVGNRATMVDGAGTTTYAYNAGNRLTLLTDPSSNLTTNTYDNNGNLTVTNANGTVTTNTWTYENRLATVTLATPATTTFTYDGDGLRRQTVTAAGTTNFIWDGQDALMETDVSNNTQVTYTQTPNLYGNLVSQRRGATTKYYHFDALGSTVALTDSGENITDTYKYYAFGGSLASTGATTNNLRFVGNLGYYNEASLSLQYLRARYYQPGAGRFISLDPLPTGRLQRQREGAGPSMRWELGRLASNTGLYLYPQPPTRRADPGGLWGCDPVECAARARPPWETDKRQVEKVTRGICPSGLIGDYHVSHLKWETITEAWACERDPHCFWGRIGRQVCAKQPTVRTPHVYTPQHNWYCDVIWELNPSPDIPGPNEYDRWRQECIGICMGTCEILGVAGCCLVCSPLIGLGLWPALACHVVCDTFIVQASCQQMCGSLC